MIDNNEIDLEEAVDPETRYRDIFRCSNPASWPNNSDSRDFGPAYADLVCLLWEQGHPMDMIHGLVRLHAPVEWVTINQQTGVTNDRFFELKVYDTVLANKEAFREAYFRVMEKAFETNVPLVVIHGLVAWYPGILKNTDKRGRSLLHLACRECGNSQVLRYIMGVCCQFAGTTDTSGRLPLHYCLWSWRAKSVETVAILVSYWPAALGCYAPSDGA